MEGAYSEAALKQYFGDAVNSYYVRTWKDAMDAIEDGAADFAVLPIENSSAGAVSEVYDLLVEYENYIVGETVLPVNHVLAGLPGSGEEEITRVYSHPQGLMQCEKYLYDHPAMEKVSVPKYCGCGLQGRGGAGQKSCGHLQRLCGIVKRAGSFA